MLACTNSSAYLYPEFQTLPVSVSGHAAVPVSAAGDWGLSFQSEGAAPIGNATAEELAQYHAFYLGDTSKKVIYLTFDCGYENGYTESILDTLKKHQVPAAFFIVGTMLEKAPDVVRRMAEEGHIVGNHTFGHPDMSAIADQDSFRTELEKLSELYLQVTGQEMPMLHKYSFVHS